MIQIYFVRHGIYSNPDNLIPCRMPDIALSEEGRFQIEELATFFEDKQVTKIFTSPIQRAVETAEILANKNHSEIEYNWDLIETTSPYQGISLAKYSKLVSKSSIFKDPYHIKFGGETHSQLIQRMSHFVATLLDIYNDGNFISVSHGDPISYYYYHLKGQIFDLNRELSTYVKYVPKGGVVRVTFDKDKRMLALEEMNF